MEQYVSVTQAIHITNKLCKTWQFPDWKALFLFLHKVIVTEDIHQIIALSEWNHMATRELLLMLNNEGMQCTSPKFILQIFNNILLSVIRSAKDANVLLLLLHNKLVKSTSPMFIWQTFNAKMDSIILLFNKDEAFKLLDVDILKEQVNTRELTRWVIDMVHVSFETPNEHSEVLVGCLLSLHALRCYQRELDVNSSDMTINVDNKALHHFISSQIQKTKKCFYLK